MGKLARWLTSYVHPRYDIESTRWKKKQKKKKKAKQKKKGLYTVCLFLSWCSVFFFFSFFDYVFPPSYLHHPPDCLLNSYISLPTFGLLSWSLNMGNLLCKKLVGKRLYYRKLIFYESFDKKKKGILLFTRMIYFHFDNLKSPWLNVNIIEVVIKYWYS